LGILTALQSENDVIAFEYFSANELVEYFKSRKENNNRKI